jgi:hypothetical protein
VACAGPGVKSGGPGIRCTNTRYLSVEMLRANKPMQDNNNKSSLRQLPKSKELPSDPNDGRTTHYRLTCECFSFSSLTLRECTTFQGSFVHLDARS